VAVTSGYRTLGNVCASDGTVYTNSEWDEGAREAGIYKDGNVIGESNSQLHGSGEAEGSCHGK